MAVKPEYSGAFWSLPAPELFQALDSGPEGLNTSDVAKRRRQYGLNDLERRRRHPLARLFFSRFKNPFLLILIFAVLVSLVLRDLIDTVIILGIIMLSAILGTLQEYRASSAVEKLRSRAALKTRMLRDGHAAEILSCDIVPGDVVLLSAGSLVPADGMVIEATDCYVNQALLTGETFPVRKEPGILPGHASLFERSNTVFLGTSVRSGTARVLIAATGFRTEFGKIAEHVSADEQENEFERGLRHFGSLFLRIMMVVVFVVLAINIILQKPTVDTLLFAVALAIGLSPELLPAILAVTLSRGATAMADIGVIVRHLDTWSHDRFSLPKSIRTRRSALSWPSGKPVMLSVISGTASTIPRRYRQPIRVFLSTVQPMSPGKLPISSCWSTVSTAFAGASMPVGTPLPTRSNTSSLPPAPISET